MVALYSGAVFCGDAIMMMDGTDFAWAVVWPKDAFNWQITATACVTQYVINAALATSDSSTQYVGNATAVEADNSTLFDIREDRDFSN